MTTRGTLYDRTIANGGGTFDMHGDNGDRADITAGYAVAIIDGTYRIVSEHDRRAFNDAVHMCIVDFPFATAIGTWVDGGVIHIDPVMVADTEDVARKTAMANHQLAYFNLNTMEEVRLS
jgi:hypothetical protein